jgi:hypothetical protein
MRRGRHVTRKGFESDARKYNRAVLLGWRVLRFTPSMIKTGEATRDISEALNRPTAAVMSIYSSSSESVCKLRSRGSAGMRGMPSCGDSSPDLITGPWFE